MNRDNQRQTSDTRWRWNAELTPRQVLRVAPLTLQLLLHGARWINRRVWTVTLLDDDSLRVQISVDFRLPLNLTPGVTVGDTPVHFVPLLFLERDDSLSFFDVRDEHGKAVPLLTRSENGALTGMALAAAAKRALDRKNSRLKISRELNAYLLAVPATSPELSKGLVRRVLDRSDGTLYPKRKVARILMRDRDFCTLLGLAVGQCVIHVPMSGPTGTRRVLKISWEQAWRRRPRQASGSQRWREWLSRMGWAPRSLTLRTSMGGVQAEHVQVVLPDGVELCSASLHSIKPHRALRALRTPGPRAARRAAALAPALDAFQPGIQKRTHLYLPHSRDFRVGLVALRVRAGRAGFLWGALLTGVMVSILLFVFSLNDRDVLSISDSAAAVLLVVPALIAGFLVRGGEHPMAQSLLKCARGLTMVLAAVPLAAAGMLVVISQPQSHRSELAAFFLGPDHPGVDEKLTVGWWVCTACAIALTLGLLVSWAFPRPIHKPRARDTPAQDDMD